MDHSQHTVTKYLSDGRKHAAIISKLFKKLDHVNNALFVVELAKSQIEHTKPIIVGFFTFQNAKLRIMELFYNFSPNSVTQTTSKSWNRTQIRCTLLLPRKNWKVVSDLEWKQSGNIRGQKIVATVSLLMHSETSSL